MPPIPPFIQRYSIGDLSADLGTGSNATDFRVFKSDEGKISDNFVGRPVRSDHFTVVLIVRGEAAIKHNLIDYILPKKSLFIITPHVVHQFQRPVDDYYIIGMSFSHDFMGQAHISEKHIDAFDFFSSQSKPQYFLSDMEAKIMEDLLLLLKEKDNADEAHPFKNEIIYHGFNLFLYEMAAILKKHRPNENVKLTRKEDIAISFIKMLSSHFKEERGVQFYADALFITPKHLSKTLKEITNKTCSELIDEMVITEAKILLEDMGQSVANVAAQLHFSDQFFFSKFFKRHTGINPSQYKVQL
ncbi:helix-turn-helix domain-containing protein [Mucilaginibacter sp.]|uniref:helix-turn-helix domain-containing protein n=1 Tax=Mucilaginibacter sp. TaxID=1882438 RepID=UPI003D140A0E